MDDETPPRNMTPSLELTASRSRTPSTSSPDALPTASTYLADEPDTGHHASTPLASVAPEVHAVTPRRNGFETAPHGLGEHTRASNFRLSLTQNSICSDGREMNAALVNMLRPEHISQGDTQSQYLPPPPTFPSAPITKISGSPGTMTSSPLGSYTGSPVHITKPALSQYRAEGLKRNANKLREQAHQHAQSMSTRSRDQLEADLVDCGCGHTGEEGDMVGRPGTLNGYVLIGRCFRSTASTVTPGSTSTATASPTARTRVCQTSTRATSVFSGKKSHRCRRSSMT